MAVVKHTGIAIAVAWPETLCKQAGAWYDGMMNALKVSKNNYYKVGHAAVVLISFSSQKSHYFDFGRYHAPYGYGRVRDEVTDHDLSLTIEPKICNEQIENVDEILRELLHNPSCHGEGYLKASYSYINFEASYKKAKEMQKMGVLKYGPFIYKGTNCSRFVRKVILAGNPHFFHKINLKVPYSISPTPLTNVYALKNKMKLSH